MSAHAKLKEARAALRLMVGAYGKLHDIVSDRIESDLIGRPLAPIAHKTIANLLAGRCNHAHTAAVRVLAEKLLPDDDDLSAAALLVHAYAQADAVDGRSVDWDDLDQAAAAARDEIGKARTKFIYNLYKQKAAEGDE